MKTRKEIQPCICGSLDHKNHPTVTPENQKPTPPASHTPTPWHVGGVHLENGKPEYIGIGNGKAIARCLVTGCVSYPEADANAAFIVRACNMHQEMLGLLKKIVYEGCLEKMPGYFQDAIDATIAKAEK